jgi:hypothetical protein
VAGGACLPVVIAGGGPVGITLAGCDVSVTGSVVVVVFGGAGDRDDCACRMMVVLHIRRQALSVPNDEG